MDFNQMLKLDYGREIDAEYKLVDYYANKFGDYLEHFKPIYDAYMFHPIHVSDEEMMKKYAEKFLKLLIEECLVYRVQDKPNDYFLEKFCDVIIGHIDDLRSQLYFEILYSNPIKSNAPLKHNLALHLISVFIETEQVAEKTLACLIRIDKLMANYLLKDDVKFGNLLQNKFQIDFFYNYLRENKWIDDKGNYVYYLERNEKINIKHCKTLLANAIATFYLKNYFRPDLSDRSARDLFSKAAKKDFGVGISPSTFRNAISTFRLNPDAMGNKIPINYDEHLDPDLDPTFYL